MLVQSLKGTLPQEKCSLANSGLFIKLVFHFGFVEHLSYSFLLFFSFMHLVNLHSKSLPKLLISMLDKPGQRTEPLGKSGS